MLAMEFVVMSMFAAGPLVRAASSLGIPKERTVAVLLGMNPFSVTDALKLLAEYLLSRSRVTAPLARRAAYGLTKAASVVAFRILSPGRAKDCISLAA